MSGNQLDRNDYSVAASQSAQANFERVAAQLEAALARRDQDVKVAMSAYQADGVSEEYAGVEREWNRAGDEVRGIISAIRGSLATNDEIAQRALQQARNALPI